MSSHVDADTYYFELFDGDDAASMLAAQRPVPGGSTSTFSLRNKERLTAWWSDKGLFLQPAAKTDYWKRTYYTPVIDKHDGPALGLEVVPEAQATMETQFQLLPITASSNRAHQGNEKSPRLFHEFDQCGLLAFVDEGCWLKCGIETVEGHPKLSVVVTNRAFSDWSTMPWSSTGARIRLHKLGESFVVEAAETGSDEFAFVRIAHLDCRERPVFMGPFACCPTNAGFTARFDYLKLSKSTTFKHSAVNDD